MQVGETSVDISSDLNYLGVLLDQNLALKSHILTKTKRAAYHLFSIRQIAKFLDLPAKKTLISLLVMSQLDCADAIFINLPKNSIHPIQNQAAKLIMNRDRCDSSTNTMRQLHWLPISYRCKYKVLLLVYICINGQAPEYLQQKLSLRNPVWITHSATERDILQIPYKQKKDLSRPWLPFGRPKILEQPTSWD